ncbi:MAG: nicotinate phosphoribosyltransferase [Anaerolineae bacterium]
MSDLHQQPMPSHTFRLDISGLRRGLYSDRYFANVVRVLEGVRDSGYTFAGTDGHLAPAQPLPIGDLIVEAQVFNRRAPRALVAGVDVVLAMLRHATGWFEGDRFVETSDQLVVEAVTDGTFTEYDENPLNVCPVLKIRGRYRDFALLETPILGVLTRASRIATNVYEVLEAANGKPVLFFPARFDLPEVQAADGYAYWLAVQTYNRLTGHHVTPSVSTDAQGLWWGGRGGGTVPHALIAAFLGDTAEAMIAFATHTPLDIPRIVLADFNNDVIGDSIKTLHAFWPRYQAAFARGDADAMRRWTLNGVRIDTSPNVRDASMSEDEPTGINPILVGKVRAALDSAWRAWALPESLTEVAQAYCRNVRIVVSGGFSRERIQQYEAEKVPVDVYGVGSRLLKNDSDTNTDFTMDVVRVFVEGQWVDLAKVGRRSNDNPDLHPVDLSAL